MAVTKIREAITYMRAHGVGPGAHGPGDELCTLNALVAAHSDGNWLQRDTELAPEFRADEEAITYVLHEQYPNTMYDYYQVTDRGMAIVKFHDDCARAGKEEELFVVLEKAAIRREEEV